MEAGINTMARDVRPTSDTNGEIEFGNTLIRTLRKAYGIQFAVGCRDEEKLRDVLRQMDEPSRSTLIHDHIKLEQMCRQPPR
jgi:hypothetical protein